MNKRLLKEIQNLYIQQSQKPLIENDYIIHFDEENTNKIYALIKAPIDSLYAYKFIRLEFKIPENYPHSPPEVYFTNHDSVRIHPNMYENGKCCATILNTWGDDKFEKWTSSMGIETILLTFHSFLDNHPYMYEPGGRDDPSYSVFVMFQSWKTCLLRYIQYETISEFADFIKGNLLHNLDRIFQTLRQLNQIYPPGNYYTRCFEIDDYYIDYNYIANTLEYYIHRIDFAQNDTTVNDEVLNNIEIPREYDCNICFDTNNDTQNIPVIKLTCSHSFHKKCLNEHITANEQLCPMCRTPLNENDYSATQQEWMINPLTKRRIKIGGRTWTYLKEQNLI